jgi:hypothetical protein
MLLPSSGGARSSALPWVTGGLATAALGASIALNLNSWADYRQLKATCGVDRTCTPAQLEGVQTQVTVSAVLLGAAGVGYALTAWQLLFGQPDQRHSPVVVVTPGPTGAWATFSSTF